VQVNYKSCLSQQNSCVNVGSHSFDTLMILDTLNQKTEWKQAAKIEVWGLILLFETA